MPKEYLWKRATKGIQRWFLKQHASQGWKQISPQVLPQTLSKERVFSRAATWLNKIWQCNGKKCGKEKREEMVLILVSQFVSRED